MKFKATLTGLFLRMLGRWLLGLGAYLLLVLLTEFLAKGWDLDQLSTRSAISQAADGLYRVLTWPYQALLQTQFLPATPALLFALNALLWAALLCGLWRFAQLVRSHSAPSCWR